MVDENFRQFIKEQISLPEEKWNEDFKNYIQKKYRELEAEILEISPEQELEKNFQRYLESLDIKKEDLMSKRILDLGCGEGEFVKYCLGEGISREVYGLDVSIKPEEINPGYRQFFLKGDFEKGIPLKNFDYIFSVGSVEAPYSEDIDRDLRKTLILALSSLNHDGEIRIFPIRKAPPVSGLAGIDFSYKKWTELLNDLKTKNWIDYELKPIDIRAAGNKPDVWLEQVLIINKKLIDIKF
ncbi:MAG: class I SAM-dependent methyltransferase [Candidatus Parcubacteria bacterium]|nr:class I SAM-dependent methyltransferase [Candidatus Parcubacteria bacterium]